MLALGSIEPRPVAVPGGVGLALTLTAGLTVDHRVGDGAHAAGTRCSPPLRGRLTELETMLGADHFPGSLT